MGTYGNTPGGAGVRFLCQKRKGRPESKAGKMQKHAGCREKEPGEWETK